MSRERYRNLIENFCKLSWLHDAPTIMEGAPIEISGSKFSLIYEEKIDPEVFFIYCECGEPPLGRDIQAYQALLRKNLFFYRDRNGPVFAIQPDSNKIVLAQQEPLDIAAPETLSNKLVLLSAQAKSWRDDLFESRSASPTTTASRSRSSTLDLLSRKNSARFFNHLK
jgi:hypothetical protein